MTYYDPTFFDKLLKVEDHHFWFRARNNVIRTLVSQLTDRFKTGYHVLEVGCGNGNVLRFLESSCQHGYVFGMDIFAESLHIARRRTDCGLIQGDMQHPPFHTPFDLIGMFDVLEHLPDDLQVLRDIHAMLSPQGVLLLTVPAHPSLWSYFDSQHHYRRYTVAALEQKLAETGYDVEFLTQYMSVLYPAIWLVRKLTDFIDRRPAVDAERTRELTERELRIVPGVNDFLLWLLSCEVVLLRRRIHLPVGTSLVAIARKL